MYTDLDLRHAHDVVANSGYPLELVTEPGPGGCPHWEIEFDQAGELVHDGGLTRAVWQGGPTDLFVFSPGWNTGRDSARELSNAMFGLIADALPPARRSSTGFVTVLWPSLLFPEDEPAADGPVLTGPAAAWGPNDLTPLVAAPKPSIGAELVAALTPAFPEQYDDLVRIGELLDTRPREMGRLAELHRLASCLVTRPTRLSMTTVSPLRGQLGPGSPWSPWPCWHPVREMGSGISSARCGTAAASLPGYSATTR